jgi:hypothetical protein
MSLGTGARLDGDVLARAKKAYTTRLVTALNGGQRLHCVGSADVIPTPGDVVLARVTSVGQHTRIERGDGRRASLFRGDEVIVTYGARYAPDQFEAEVPDTLADCDLVAAGGLAGRVVAAHGSVDQPTRLQPVGLLADDAGVLNLRRFTAVDVGAGQGQAPGVPVILVVGTSMNAGKTTTAGALVRGLTAGGLRVGAAKVTGTGAGGDRWLLTDSGAHRVLDFTDAGYASTFHVPVWELVAIFTGLVRQLAADGVEAIVVEVADGLLQPETRQLLAAPDVRRLVSAMVFAAGDALGAVAGVAQLRAMDFPVTAVSGRLTSSPLAVREAEAALDVPVLTVEQLGAATTAARVTRRLVTVG